MNENISLYVCKTFGHYCIYTLYNLEFAVIILNKLAVQSIMSLFVKELTVYCTNHFSLSPK